jgi:hypothetical protein
MVIMFMHTAYLGILVLGGVYGIMNSIRMFLKRLMDD